LVHKDVSRPLVEKMKARMTEFYGVDPSKSADKTKIINEFHVRRLESTLNEAHGGEVIYVGGDGKVDLAQRYVPPAIILNPKLTSALMMGQLPDI
jgi:aldehyde dehydrogenase (NAD+)